MDWLKITKHTHTHAHRLNQHLIVAVREGPRRMHQQAGLLVGANLSKFRQIGLNLNRLNKLKHA